MLASSVCADAYWRLTLFFFSLPQTRVAPEVFRSGSVRSRGYIPTRVRSPPSVCVQPFERMHACNEGTLLSRLPRCNRHDSVSGWGVFFLFCFFPSSHSISVELCRFRGRHRLSRPPLRAFSTPSNSSSIFFIAPPFSISRQAANQSPSTLHLSLSLHFTFPSLRPLRPVEPLPVRPSGYE